MGVIKTSPPCPMLVVQPMSDFSLHALSRDSQGWLRSHKPANGAMPCEFVGDLITSYPSTSRGPEKPQRMLGRDVIQHLLALHINIHSTTLLFTCCTTVMHKHRDLGGVKL